MPLNWKKKGYIIQVSMFDPSNIGGGFWSYFEKHHYLYLHKVHYVHPRMVKTSCRYTGLSICEVIHSLIILCDTIAYFIISCSVLPYHTLLYYILLYHIILYHTISYFIISYIVILYYIIQYQFKKMVVWFSYDIIQYNNILDHAIKY